MRANINAPVPSGMPNLGAGPRAQLRRMGRARGELAAAGTSHGRRGPYKWTPDRVEEELEEFLADRTTWPTADEFNAAGHRALLAAVERSPSGIGYWANRLGCELAPMQDRAPYPLHVALAEARELIAAHGKLPNIMRLRELGHPRLAYLVQKSGGAKAFRPL